jgi:hypothetical protein
MYQALSILVDHKKKGGKFHNRLCYRLIYILRAFYIEISPFFVPNRNFHDMLSEILLETYLGIK